jgi:hypothetical protein
LGDESMVYVDTGEAIVGFPAAASGDVPPAVTIIGPNTVGPLGQNFSGFQSLAHDAAGNLYVAAESTNVIKIQSFIYEFAGSANGNVSPIRAIQLPSEFVVQSIAVDAAGYIYAGGYQFIGAQGAGEPTSFLVFAPGASGAAQPVSGGTGNSSYYFSIGLNSNQDLYTAGGCMPALETCEVEEFGPASAGNPLLRSFGLKQKIFGIAISPTSGNVYVSAASDPSSFSPNVIAFGNPQLTRLLGSLNLAGPTWMAFDTGGELYVLGGGIEVFAANATGNATPLRVISGANTGLLGGGTGITVVGGALPG